MKKIITLLLLLTLASGVNVNAAEEVELKKADINLTDKASLLRGAHHFVAYCLGCHSLKQMRYLRIAIDTDTDEKEILKNIAPLDTSIYNKLQSAMNKHDAEKWFGTQPPDLSLIARSRGADWLYSYLKSYYTDEKRPYGVNNTIFADTAMPNPFWQLQGEQQLMVKKTMSGHQNELVVIEEGSLSAKEFDLIVNDLVNFLVYVGEPTQVERERMGKYVIFFLFMFLIIAYLLKKEYWKDID